MDKKICKTCNIEKSLDEIVKNKRVKSGYGSICKKCFNIKQKEYSDSDIQKEYRKKYRQENSEKNKEYLKEYRENNKEKSKEYAKEYWNSNKDSLSSYKNEWDKNNKDYLKKYAKDYYLDNNDFLKKKSEEYRKNNKDKINEYTREKKKTDPLFKLRHTIGNAILQSIKLNGYSKKTRTHQILGCSFEEFKLHLESKFEPWMSWENHGLYNGELNYGWDIDHIIPIASSNSEDDIIKLNHYTNLQPLCGYINRYIKRDNII